MNGGTKLMEETEVLIAQINVLCRDLARVRKLVLPPAIKPEFSMQIFGKFNSFINPLLDQLKEVEEEVQAGNLSPDKLAEMWQKYVSIKQEAQKVFAQCLDFLGGIAVRENGWEEGICKVAEYLVRYYAQQTGFNWASVMIVGEERLFDKVARTTQFIRIRFPDWDMWSLPFTAHEFGQLVANSIDADELKQFFNGEPQTIRRLVQDKELSNDLQGVAPNIQALHQKYEAGLVGTEAVEQLCAEQPFCMHNLFADVFATYFLGPAYLYARFYLRLIPTEISRGQPYKLPTTHRMTFMLWTLRSMNREAKKAERLTTHDSGPYDDELKRFQSLWEKTVQPVYSGYRPIPPEYAKDINYLGKPYDDWFPVMYRNLRRSYGEAGFTGNDWDKAVELAKKLLTDSPQVEADISLPIILNAAWYCRARRPEQTATIEKKVKVLAQQAVMETPPAGMPSLPKDVTSAIQGSRKIGGE
jgi:hypothetical protein